MALPCGTMGFLRFVIVVFPEHTHLLFSMLGRHWHTSETPFKWRFADGPMIAAAFSGIWIPSPTFKKNVVKVFDNGKKLSRSAHDRYLPNTAVFYYVFQFEMQPAGRRPEEKVN